MSGTDNSYDLDASQVIPVETISTDDDNASNVDSASEVSIDVDMNTAVPVVLVQATTEYRMQYFNGNGFVKTEQDPHRELKNHDRWVLWDNQRMYWREINIDLIPHTVSMHRRPTNSIEEKAIFDIVKDIPMHQITFNDEARAAKLSALLSRENKRKFGRWTFNPRPEVYAANGIFVDNLIIRGEGYSGVSLNFSFKKIKPMQPAIV